MENIHAHRETILDDCKQIKNSKDGLLVARVLMYLEFIGNDDFTGLLISSRGKFRRGIQELKPVNLEDKHQRLISYIMISCLL